MSEVQIPIPPIKHWRHRDTATTVTQVSDPDGGMGAYRVTYSNNVVMDGGGSLLRYGNYDLVPVNSIFNDEYGHANSTGRLPSLDSKSFYSSLLGVSDGPFLEVDNSNYRFSGWFRFPEETYDSDGRLICKIKLDIGDGAGSSITPTSFGQIGEWVYFEETRTNITPYDSPNSDNGKMYWLDLVPMSANTAGGTNAYNVEQPGLQIELYDIQLVRTGPDVCNDKYAANGPVSFGGTGEPGECFGDGKWNRVFHNGSSGIYNYGGKSQGQGWNDASLNDPLFNESNGGACSYSGGGADSDAIGCSQNPNYWGGNDRVGDRVSSPEFWLADNVRMWTRDASPSGIYQNYAMWAYTYFIPEETGTYRFYIDHDDHFGISFNGGLKWEDGSPHRYVSGHPCHSFDIDFIAGQRYPTVMGFWASGGPTGIRIRYTTPSDTHYSGYTNQTSCINGLDNARELLGGNYGSIDSNSDEEYSRSIADYTYAHVIGQYYTSYDNNTYQHDDGTVSPNLIAWECNDPFAANGPMEWGGTGLPGGCYGDGMWSVVWNTHSWQGFDGTDWNYRSHNDFGVFMGTTTTGNINYINSIRDHWHEIHRKRYPDIFEQWPNQAPAGGGEYNHNQMWAKTYFIPEETGTYRFRVKHDDYFNI